MVVWGKERWDLLKCTMKQKKENWAKEIDSYKKEPHGEQYGYTLKEVYTKEEVDTMCKKHNFTLPESMYIYLTTISRELFGGSYPIEIKLNPWRRGWIQIEEGGCNYGRYILVRDKIIYSDDEDSDSEYTKTEQNLKYGEIIQTGFEYPDVIRSFYIYLDQFLNKHKLVHNNNNITLIHYM